MEKNQPTFLLKISGNVLEKLKKNQAVLSASWDYPHKLTSVFVKAEVLNEGEAIKIGRAIRKHFSIYGIIRSVHYCRKGLESALRVDRSKVKRERTASARHATLVPVLMD